MDCLKDISIKGFIETSFLDWPGNICSTLFLPYCNFRCAYCHNADLVLNPDRIADIPLANILERLCEFKGWVEGVCITGGEPTLHSWLTKLIESIKREDFLIKIDTNGSNPAVLLSLIKDGLIDYVAMDIKSPLFEEEYVKITRTFNVLESVKKSIEILLEGIIPYEFRLTVVPLFHRPEDIYQLAMELKGAQKFRLQNFNPSNTLDPALKTLVPYDDKELIKIQKEVDWILSNN